MLDAGQNIITRHLPKTGQVTAYAPGPDFGCDGFYQKGWWPGRDATNNRARWIQKAIVGDDIVVDRATGLMWPADWTGAGGNGGGLLAWFAAILWANALNFAGFSDWRLPNIAELFSLVEFEGAGPFIYQPPFSNVVSGNYWSGTTYQALVTSAYALRFNLGINWPFGKVATCYCIAVRDSVL